MKKLLFLMIVCINCNFVFAQTVLNYLNPTNKVSVSSNDVYFQKFILRSNIYSTDPELRNIQNVEKVSLISNDYCVFQIPLLQNATYNYLIVAYNTVEDNYVYFYQIRETLDKIVNTRVFESDGTFIYSTSTDGGTFAVNLTQNTFSKSPFRDCMERLENDYKDTFSGYLIWNLEPAAQIMGALHCKACTLGWIHSGC